MPVEQEMHNEPLEEDELEFLKKKESKDRSLYYKLFQLQMFLCFVISYAVAWYRALGGKEHAFSPTRFFISVAILLSISLISTFIAYYLNLYKVQQDIHHKTKTIEICHIMNKVYFPSKNAYYFYLDSRVKLSIDVSYEDYLRMSIGDEVCIEYTTRSKQYLGYY